MNNSDSSTSEYIYDIFISYSFSDGIAVSVLCDYLEQKGMRCFVAERNMPKGSHFANIIPWALDHSRMMLAILSRQFNESAHTSREIVIAADSGMPILTVKLEDCELKGEKKYYLTNLNWINAEGGIVSVQMEIEKSCRNILSNLPPRKKTESSFSPQKKKLFSRYMTPTTVLLLAIFVACIVFGVVLTMKKEHLEAKVLSSTVVETSIQPIEDKNEAENKGEHVESVSPKEDIKTDARLREARKLKESIQSFNNRLRKATNDDAIDNLILDIVDASVKSENVSDKMEALEKAVAATPTYHKRLKDITKEKMTTATVDMRDKNPNDLRIEFYMGILYYYGIADNSHQPNYEKALDRFKVVSGNISRFYEALCEIQLKYPVADVKTILEELRFVKTEKGGDFCHKSLSEDAQYYLSRLEGENSVLLKDKEDYYLTNTNTYSKDYLLANMRELIDKYGLSTMVKKSLYCEDEVSILEKVAEIGEAKYEVVMAMNELAWYNNKIGNSKKAENWIYEANKLVDKLVPDDKKDKLIKAIKQNINNINKKRK